ncbi:hypothetical protein HAP47_0038100 [Bradyrhizobium sp. 41S5]|uniref:hypothetical protein n=1 Tax=Bradyrhizobium sp. 41S5 TaxID=1404443 RepID=UPI00156AB4B6|nr:hypothetical protein [Bradyrhizobium sp. 41S5]UFX49310.1 hypothetical protein HAP47_0038100 [Bradyrhizobium sp. 41S5]
MGLFSIFWQRPCDGPTPKNLRASIDAPTGAVSALKAKGMSSAQVVAVNLTNGVLTLFTKTA